MKTQTPTKRTAHRLAAVLSLVLVFATGGAWAANVKWTGAEDNYWNNTNNWKDKDSSRPLPTNDSMFFDSQYYDARFTENEVVFDGAYVNNYGTYIRNVGTAGNPLVFRATSPANGLKFGDSKHTYIADNSAVYLRLKSGTWSTGGCNLQFGTSGSGCLELTDGASLTIGNYLHLQGGSLVLENATVTVADNRDLRPGANAMATIELNDGGTLIIPTINQQTYGVVVRFNGGTLKANAANGYGFVRDSDTVSVRVAENGGTIDAGNFNIAVNRPIAAEGANDGGMTFKGGGSVSLKYANTYVGETKIAVRTKLAVTSAELTRMLANGGIRIIKPEDVSAKGTFKLLSKSDGDCTAAEYALIKKGAGLEGATFGIDEDGDITVTVSHTPQTWAGAAETSAVWSGSNWDSGVAFDDGNDAVFTTDGAIAEVDANFSAYTLTFNENATLTGTGTLTVPTITVADGKMASIAGSLAGDVEKTGAGSLTLGSSRAGVTTTLTEGKLVANAPIGTLVFGTDSPVTFDYGGQTLSTIPASAVGGGDVTLKNGTFGANNVNFTMNSGKLRVEGDSAAMNMNAGSFGQTSGTAAKYSQTGGTLNAQSQFRLYCGEMNLTNVTFNASLNVEVGNTSASAQGAMTMSGCAASVSGNLNVFNGEFVITNGTSTVGNDKRIYMSSNGNTAMVALKAGGTLTAPFIQQYQSTGKGTILFDGGTLKANAANGNGLVLNNAGLAVEVTANGGTIDAGSYAVTVHRAIVDKSGETGAMTYKGGGSVTLSVAPTYTGITMVEVGTKLVVPEAIAGEKLAFTIPAGLEKGVYEVVRISGGGAFAVGAIDDAAKPADGSAQFRFNTDRTAIVCVYGYEQGEIAYIGGSGGSLSVADNWTTGVVPTSGNVTFDFATATTLIVGDTFRADTITIPSSSAVVTIGSGDLHLSGSLTNANRLAIAQDASLTVDGDLVADGQGNFLYSNEGTVTVGRAVANNTTTVQYAVNTGDTQPIRTGGFLSDKRSGRVYYKMNGSWVVGADGFAFNNPENRWNSSFYVQNGSATLYSSADWTLANSGQANANNGDHCVCDLSTYDNNASLTIDTSNYYDQNIAHTITLNGRIAAQGPVTIKGCGTVEVNTTGSNANLPEDLKHTCLTNAATLFVTDTATLQVNAGRKITGNGTISLAAGTTLKLMTGADRQIPTFANLSLALPDEGTATIRIDGEKELRGGEYVLFGSAPSDAADHVTVTGTAIAGRKYEVKAVEVTEDETTVTKLVLNIQPTGLMVIFR